MRKALVLICFLMGCSGEDPNGFGGAGGAPPDDSGSSLDGGGWPDASNQDGSGGWPGDASNADTSVEGGGFDDAAADSSADAGDAAWMCDPAAFPLPNEGLTEAPGLGGCPPGMAPVDTYCMDRFEASLELVVPSGGITSWSPFQNPGSTAVRAVSIETAVPQAYISQLQAAAACANAGKRLCSDTEWLWACTGPAGNTYPYGNTRQDGVCNDSRSVHPAVEYFGTTDPWIFSELDNACLDQLPDSLDLCGANTGCFTPDGVYDLMGNLHEWTQDPSGTFRGGFYVDTRINGEGCLYETTAHDVTYWDYSTGFRCCAD